VWDTRIKKANVAMLLGPHICGEGIDINDKGQVLTASWDRGDRDDNLQLWSLKKHAVLRTIPWTVGGANKWGSMPYSCRFNHDYTMIGACGAHRAQAKIWDVTQDYKSIGLINLDKSGYTVAFSRHDANGALFAVGGEEHKIRVYELKGAKLKRKKKKKNAWDRPSQASRNKSKESKLQ
jgi:WD40 repeat protein